MTQAMTVFGVSMALALGLTPVVRACAIRYGFVAQPRDDRWHTTPTALLGGIGIFVAFATSRA